MFLALDPAFGPEGLSVQFPLPYHISNPSIPCFDVPGSEFDLFWDVARIRLDGVFASGVFGLRRGAGSDFSFHRAQDGLVTTVMTMLRCT